MTPNPQNPGSVAGEAAIREATKAVLAPIGNMTDRHTAVLRTMERRTAFQQVCNPHAIESLLAELDRLRASQSDGASGGWVTAPAKPTTEMIAAGMKRMFDEKRYSAPWDDVIDLMYRDMLAAAPSKSQGDKHGE